MSIAVTCDNCRVSFRAKDEHAGKRGKCPKCQAPIVVPQREVVEELIELPVVGEVEPEKKASPDSEKLIALPVVGEAEPEKKRQADSDELIALPVVDEAKPKPKAWADSEELIALPVVEDVQRNTARRPSPQATQRPAPAADRPQTSAPAKPPARRATGCAGAAAPRRGWQRASANRSGCCRTGDCRGRCRVAATPGAEAEGRAPTAAEELCSMAAGSARRLPWHARARSRCPRRIASPPDWCPPAWSSCQCFTSPSSPSSATSSCTARRPSCRSLAGCSFCSCSSRSSPSRARPVRRAS